MRLTLEECNGDVDHWLQVGVDQFEDIEAACQASGDQARLRREFQDFHARVTHAASVGIGDSRCWSTAARHVQEPHLRLAYYARAYELLLEEIEDHNYGVECTMRDFFELAEFLQEMGVVYEAEGDFRKAADHYQRSLVHVQEAFDYADADLQSPRTDGPRRPKLIAGLERMQALLAAAT